MAALLRSARLLKLSPSGLLQITGTSRNGPPLGRLYSGATGGKDSGVCTRQVASGYSVSRGLWPFAAGSYAGVRSYAGVPEPRGGPREDVGTAVRSKQAQQFDWALAKLDSSVRRTGRITKTLLQRIFHDICRTGYPSGNQALLLLRSCGSLLPEMPLAERTELAHRVWDKLQELGASYDASHYNAMLKVYLQNEFKFSPTDFLAKMEAANVQPNRVTFQRLIAAYCNEGDIEGASTILGFMKSKDLPITEAVFNALITGHARAGDMESAENILSVMKGAGIEPGPDTYIALLNAYAERGDMEKIKETLQAVESTDASLMDRDLMQVVYTLAKHGHQQHVAELVERMRHERGYVPDAMNLCLSLITQGQDGAAFTMLKTFPTLQQEDVNGDGPTLGNFFLRHCVNMETSVEKIGGYCKELLDSNLHAAPLQFALYCALEANKTAMAVEMMKVMKDQGLPIRPHYFWPLLTAHIKDKNIAGVREVAKGMQELGVAADSETYSRYLLPAFPSAAEAEAVLKEVGFSTDSATFLESEVRAEAFSGNLEALYTRMSDPSFPALDLSIFRGNMIAGFKKSSDVTSMAKITSLLSTDARFSNNPSESVGYFLYNLVDGMSETEAQAQEDKLRQYFHQLKTMNVAITENIYRGIRNRLDSYHVPELIKDVIVLVEGRTEGVDATNIRFPADGKVFYLEKRMAELKAEGKDSSQILKQIILTHCMEENLEKALEVKRQHADDMMPGGYAALIQLCCRHDNIEEALDLKRELSRKDSTVALDAGKYVTLVNALVKHGKVDEAVDLLKEMKEKEVAVRDATSTSLFHVLNAAALQGEVDTIKRLQDTIFTLGLVKPSANMLSPLVFAYLEKKDIDGALEASMECHKSYGQLPRIHDIIVALVEKGDTEMLQKAMDFVSQERGEMTMLYDLFFAFMHTGRYREARKVIETPGLRSRPGRLQWFAEKLIAGKEMAALEQLVDMTSKLFECDRDEMYSYVLRLCKESNDWQKAEATWTKMQEENVIPRERTLRLLADVLKSNGQEVPFEVPEEWFKSEGAPADQVESSGTVDVTNSPSTRSQDYQTRLLTLVKKGKAQEAYGVVKDAESQGVSMGPLSYDRLIKALLSEGSLDDARMVQKIATSHIPGFNLTDVATNLLIVTLAKTNQCKEGLDTMKTMLQSDQIPSQLAISRLVQSLGNNGEVELIQEVEQLIKVSSVKQLSPMLFVNNTALAHIKRGELDVAVEGLETVLTQEGPNSISYLFRKVLEDKNEKALDRLSIMAERLANHFASYRTATDLFLQLMEVGRVEDAKFMLARCNAVAEQKDMLVSQMSRLAQKPGQSGIIKALFTLMPGFAEKDVYYSYLMKSHSVDNDLVSAKALLSKMEEEGVAIDNLTLKRMAVMYRQAGETCPFTEPPESFKFYADQLRTSKTPVVEE